MIKVKAKFNEIEVQNNIIRSMLSFQGDIKELGWMTATKGQQFIVDNIKRPGSSGNLIRNIQCDDLGGMGQGYTGFGIGKITELNKNAPYWYVLNYGKTVGGNSFIPGNGKQVPAGIFVPGIKIPFIGSFREGRWIAGGWGDSGRSYSFIAKKAIEPINYIEYMDLYVREEINKIITKVDNWLKG